MKSISEKALKEIELLEKVSLTPNSKYSTTNSNSKKVDVEVQVDTSDEQNVDENADIFTSFNQSAAARSLKVDVQIDEDFVEEDEDKDSSDSLSEDGKDTVFGQGTNPNPEDETYLSLLKKTTPNPKVKVHIER